MDDFIRREAAIETLSEFYHHKSEIQHIALREALNRVPTADVRPVVRGKWIRGNESRTGPTKDSYICSVCGEKTLSGFCGNPAKTNFCPNCGADMRGPNLDTTKGDNHD